MKENVKRGVSFILTVFMVYCMIITIYSTFRNLEGEDVVEIQEIVFNFSYYNLSIDDLSKISELKLEFEKKDNGNILVTTPISKYVFTEDGDFISSWPLLFIPLMENIKYLLVGFAICGVWIMRPFFIDTSDKLIDRIIAEVDDDDDDDEKDDEIGKEKNDKKD